MKRSFPIINLEQCNRCGICVEQCPEEALQMTPQGPVFKDPNTCTFCALCENICPRATIRAPYTISWAPEQRNP